MPCTARTPSSRSARVSKCAAAPGDGASPTPPAAPWVTDQECQVQTETLQLPTDSCSGTLLRRRWTSREAHTHSGTRRPACDFAEITADLLDTPARSQTTAWSSSLPDRRPRRLANAQARDRTPVFEPYKVTAVSRGRCATTGRVSGAGTGLRPEGGTWLWSPPPG
jgi:hypothetical protein